MTQEEYMLQAFNIVTAAREQQKKYDKAKGKVVPWAIALVKAKNAEEKLKALKDVEDYLGMAFTLDSISTLKAELKKDMPEAGFANIVLPTMVMAKMLQELDKIKLADILGEK